MLSSDSVRLRANFMSFVLFFLFWTIRVTYLALRERFCFNVIKTALDVFRGQLSNFFLCMRIILSMLLVYFFNFEKV